MPERMDDPCPIEVTKVCHVGYRLMHVSRAFFCEAGFAKWLNNETTKLMPQMVEKFSAMRLALQI